MRRLVLAQTLAAIIFAAAASAQPATDSGAPPRQPDPGAAAVRRPALVTTQDALAWGGGLAVAAVLDATIRDFSQTKRSATSNGVAGVGNALGTAYTWGPALVGTWLVGTLARKQKVADAALLAAASGAVTGGITAVLKAAIGRQRPPGGNAAAFDPFGGDTSFPSGHTSFAFAVASSLAHSTPDGWSDVGLYAAATLTGLSRINHDRHWATDVVAGAALGYFVGRQLRVGRGVATPIAVPGGVGFSLTF
ncbi:MAG: phosphatase PAP2 family protein [Gemmatimonadales bacterium]